MAQLTMCDRCTTAKAFVRATRVNFDAGDCFAQHGTFTLDTDLCVPCLEKFAANARMQVEA